MIEVIGRKAGDRTDYALQVVSIASPAMFHQRVYVALLPDNLHVAVRALRRVVIRTAPSNDLHKIAADALQTLTGKRR